MNSSILSGGIWSRRLLEQVEVAGGHGERATDVVDDHGQELAAQALQVPHPLEGLAQLLPLGAGRRRLLLQPGHGPVLEVGVERGKALGGDDAAVLLADPQEVGRGLVAEEGAGRVGAQQ